MSLRMEVKIAAQSQRERVVFFPFFVFYFGSFIWTLEIFKIFILKHIGN